MIITKSSSFREVLSSRGGLHLTAYVKGSKDPVEVRRKIGGVVFSALEQLVEGAPEQARRRLLAPLLSLMSDSKRLKELPEQFAIFRSESTFRIVQLPMPIDEQCFVATSFHIKPLLGWMQVDREYLLLGLCEGRATLYAGARDQLRKIGEISSAEGTSGSQARIRRGGWKLKKFRARWADETAEWMHEELMKLPRGSRPALYLAGESTFVRRLAQRLRYRNLSLTWAGQPFDEFAPARLCAAIREEQDAEAKSRLRKVLQEFFLADEMNLGRRNLFEIATAVVRGRVSKLVVTSGMQIFGKIDSYTGGLKLNGSDKDHEDDDILDDLAQLVLAQGGEVHVAPQHEMPKGWPAVAILRPEEENVHELRPAPDPKESQHVSA